jgi:DNA-binding MltR family transcriptional regulator
VWMTGSEDHKSIIQEIASSPDRTAAIVACAVLEESLKARLEASLRKKSSTVKKLLASNGPLGTIFARNSLAYAMEIYDQRTRHNIETIATIRNVFAHRTAVRDFNSDVPRQLCEQLRMNVHAVFARKAMVDAGYELAEIKPRQMFELAVSETLTIILWSGPGSPPESLFTLVSSSSNPGGSEWIEIPKP